MPVPICEASSSDGALGAPTSPPEGAGLLVAALEHAAANESGTATRATRRTLRFADIEDLLRESFTASPSSSDQPRDARRGYSSEGRSHAGMASRRSLGAALVFVLAVVMIGREA